MAAEGNNGICSINLFLLLQKHRYIGDEYGRMSVLKYQTEGAELLNFPYYVSLDHITGTVAL